MRMKSLRRVQLALAMCLVLGGLVAFSGLLWRPLYEASSVDVILTPEELRDHKFVDVVQRTQQHTHERGESPLPVGLLGAMISIVALIGLVCLGNGARES